MGRTRRAVLRAVGGAGLAGLATPSGTRAGPDDVETVRVPRDRPTIQAGVDAAGDGDGDLVLVDEGTYEEAVEVSTPGITLRGVDRNAVVVDGGFEREHGVLIEADGVAVENLTARHFHGNAFYWRNVEGFRGSYLTAYNDGYYGIYAYRSHDGRFEHSYASGHPDAGFYLGRNHPFDAVVADVVAEHNAIGYSGTSAGGDLTVRDSVWRHNAVGILPNTLDEEDAPQRSCRIVGNEVVANDGDGVPLVEYAYPMVGVGILVWGGSDNLIAENEVRDHDRFGIALQHSVVAPSGNVVSDNEVSGSGAADLALGRPAGDGNRVANNAFATADPPGIERDASDGSGRVADSFERRAGRAERADLRAGAWRDRPEPGDRLTMPDPDAPPRPATRSASWDG